MRKQSEERREMIDRGLKEWLRTGVKQRGADLIGWNKSNFNREIKQIGEEEPERLERLKAEVRGEKEEKKKEPERIAEPKREKKPFSFRADIEDIGRWRAYAETRGQTMENLCSAAINDYIAENPLLTEDETQLYELLLKRGF